MRAFMMISEQTDGQGQRTDGARVNGMPAYDDQTSIQKLTRTAGGTPLVACTTKTPQRLACLPGIWMHVWYAMTPAISPRVLILFED